MNQLTPQVRRKGIIRRLKALPGNPNDSYRKIGDDFGVSRQRVHQIRVEENLPSPGPAKGERHPDFKGRRTRHGVPYVYEPEHPRADEDGYIPLKYVIVEELMGEDLAEDEEVLPNDGDESNLDEGNLIVVSREEYERWKGRKYSRKQLLTLLRWLAVKNGHTPSKREISEHLPVGHRVYSSAFGSIRRAQEEAGLVPNDQTHNRRWTKSDLPEDFQASWLYLASKYDSAEEILEDV